MDGSQALPELVAMAQTNAQAIEARISQITSPKEDSKELREATAELEAAAVDIYSLFEARMQHHFKRGPFSRKLKALLVEAGKTDLADRVHQYYLAINVLKHGKGASHRELLASSDTFIVLKPVDDVSDDTQASLVDVRASGFFEGLCRTILEASEFLETRKV